MPIFEYKCAECGKVTGFLESVGNRKKRLCSHCGSVNMHKQLSSFAVGVRQNGTDGRCLSCTDDKRPYANN